MKFPNLAFISVITLLSANASADTLVLMDAQQLKGKVISIDNKSALFELGGQQLKVERERIKSITFDHEPVEIAAVETKNSTLVKSSVGKVIPASTPMMVRMTSTINSSKHPVGYKFTARLEADIVINNETVIPRRTIVYGTISESKKSNRLIGNSNMSIKFTDMMVNNKLIPIRTSDIKGVSESTTKDTLARTARFAAIGGLANGSEGAGNMAKAGLGVSLLTGGSSVNIPSGTLLEFALTSPVTL